MKEVYGSSEYRVVWHWCSWLAGVLMRRSLSSDDRSICYPRTPSVDADDDDDCDRPAGQRRTDDRPTTTDTRRRETVWLTTGAVASFHKILGGSTLFLFPFLLLPFFLLFSAFPLPSFPLSCPPFPLEVGPP